MQLRWSRKLALVSELWRTGTFFGPEPSIENWESCRKKCNWVNLKSITSSLNYHVPCHASSSPGYPNTRINNAAGQPQGFRKVSALIVRQPFRRPHMFSCFEVASGSPGARSVVHVCSCGSRWIGEPKQQRTFQAGAPGYLPRTALGDLFGCAGAFWVRLEWPRAEASGRVWRPTVSNFKTFALNGKSQQNPLQPQIPSS